MTRVIEVVRRGRQGRAGAVNTVAKYEALSANTALLNADFGSAYRVTAAITITLPTEVDGAWTAIIDADGGDATLSATGNINGSAADLVIPDGFSAFVYSDGTNYFTRFYFSEAVSITNAAASAAAALASENAADADATATAADRVQTGLDAAATAADRVQTGLDAVATAADRVQTGLDADAAAQSAIDAAVFDPALYAPLASPAMTGTPTAPTAAAATNNTQLATTAHVKDAIPEVLNASGSAPIYACRAWGNINGTGVIAIRASGNVSSITDNGTGDYTITFTTAMPDANYAVNVTATDAAENSFPSFATTLATTSFRLRVKNTNNTNSDGLIISFSVFR